MIIFLSIRMTSCKGNINHSKEKTLYHLITDNLESPYIKILKHNPHFFQLTLYLFNTNKDNSPIMIEYTLANIFILRSNSFSRLSYPCSSRVFSEQIDLVAEVCASLLVIVYWLIELFYIWIELNNYSYEKIFL